MKKFLLALSIVGAFLVVSSAQAGFMIEPYAGIGLSADIEEEGNTNEPKAGMVFGARLGYSFMGLMFGGEYESLSSKLESPTFEYNSTSTSYGVFVGYELPIMFRFYATYFLSSESVLDDYNIAAGIGGGQMKDYTSSGTALKLGVSYTGLPFVAINVEMVKQSYDERSYTIEGNAIPGVDGETKGEIDAETTITQITLSLPLP